MAPHDSRKHTKTDKYWYPIYALPPECKGTNKSKCPTRADINAGALSGRGLELAWASNPMDVYFMQVQGTGIGVTEQGQSFRFSFAGKNNQPFVSYSEFLKNNPGFCPVTGYYNQIEWLNQHPSEALQATSVSPSFVFFSSARYIICRFAGNDFHASTSSKKRFWAFFASLTGLFSSSTCSLSSFTNR